MNHETPPNNDPGRQTLDEAYQELVRDKIDQLDPEEQAALRLYFDRLTTTPTPGDDDALIDRFADDYWGTFSSVQEFIDNWAYDMEPLESVERLLYDHRENAVSMNIAEMALVSHLAGDIDFVFDHGKVVVFTKEGK